MIENLRPCLFCGYLPNGIDAIDGHLCDALNAVINGPKLELEENWQNAWGWKEISRLESVLKSARKFIQEVADEDYRGNRPTICSNAHNWLFQHPERSDKKEKVGE